MPSASSASQSFTQITTSSLTQLRILSGISTSSLLLAYFLSPPRGKHPYLLWTSLIVSVSGVTDLILRPRSTKTITAAREYKKERKSRGVESSYEVLGASDRDSDSAEDSEESVNGEEVRADIEGFRTSQAIRTGLSAVGFVMAVVGVWGDGA
jgi:autophagy-related protein 33